VPPAAHRPGTPAGSWGQPLATRPTAAPRVHHYTACRRAVKQAADERLLASGSWAWFKTPYHRRHGASLGSEVRYVGRMSDLGGSALLFLGGAVIIAASVAVRRSDAAFERNYEWLRKSRFHKSLPRDSCISGLRVGGCPRLGGMGAVDLAAVSRSRCLGTTRIYVVALGRIINHGVGGGGRLRHVVAASIGTAAQCCCCR
jgi:hypothetical protein